ncbi:MAG: glycosyltransferase family 39 protein [Candidatus Binatia bacterium]|nr:glycosyltransferase family 39 protein [Candidatus Binatia bacterium]
MTRPEPIQSQALLHTLLLIALCGVLYFPYLGQVPFFDKGEPREALAVQDIVQRGEWLFPLKRATAIPSKPPLFHWSAALTYQVTGRLDEATIRFPSALYATLGVLLIYVLGRKLFGAQAGLLAGAVLATTLIYQTQALSARVDMTLCFFVTASLVLFYFIYRGFLTNQLWYFVLYALVGIGTLAKGPLGILLPGLVIASFLALRRRWDLFAKFCFHPGAVVTLILAVGWYGLAATRGGEGFVDRQILRENLERFAGGSGHSHPVYFYLPYLFSQGLPWSLFLPLALWDGFKKGFFSDDDRLFTMLWFLVMFLFFSIAMGKRSVYLLPLYPALALLTAKWIYDQASAVGGTLVIYRSIAVFAGVTGFLLLIVTLGALWNHDPGWFFAPIERLLKPKDRANLLVVKNAIAGFGVIFTAAACLSGVLWLATAHSLWLARARSAARRLVPISILVAFIGWSMILPAIAESKSYRAFMEEVNRRVEPNDELYLFGGFNSDPVIFYRGGLIAEIDDFAQAVAGKLGPGKVYIIMARRSWEKIQRQSHELPPPLLESAGAGPEGDAPLVLVQVDGL